MMVAYPGTEGLPIPPPVQGPYASVCVAVGDPVTLDTLDYGCGYADEVPLPAALGAVIRADIPSYYHPGNKITLTLALPPSDASMRTEVNTCWVPDKPALPEGTDINEWWMFLNGDPADWVQAEACRNIDTERTAYTQPFPAQSSVYSTAVGGGEMAGGYPVTLKEHAHVRNWWGGWY